MRHVRPASPVPAPMTGSGHWRTRHRCQRPHSPKAVLRRRGKPPQTVSKGVSGWVENAASVYPDDCLGPEYLISQTIPRIASLICLLPGPFDALPVHYCSLSNAKRPNFSNGDCPNNGDGVIPSETSTNHDVPPRCIQPGAMIAVSLVKQIVER